jgi:hypothetical protein
VITRHLLATHQVLVAHQLADGGHHFRRQAGGHGGQRVAAGGIGQQPVAQAAHGQVADGAKAWASWLSMISRVISSCS